eukprot:38786_1
MMRWFDLWITFLLLLVRHDHNSNTSGNTVQLQSSLPPAPPPFTLQSMYNNRQNMMTRPQSNSLPSVPRHHHRSFQIIDFDDSPENDPNDEFTPPPIQPTAPLLSLRMLLF